MAKCPLRLDTLIEEEKQQTETTISHLLHVWIKVENYGEVKSPWREATFLLIFATMPHDFGLTVIFTVYTKHALNLNQLFSEKKSWKLAFKCFKMEKKLTD